MCGCGCGCVIVRVLHCAYVLHCACCRRAKAKREAKERSAKKAVEAEAKAIKDEELRVREVEWGTEADWDLFSLKLPCGKDKTSKRRREVCAHAYMHTRTYARHARHARHGHKTRIHTNTSTRTRPLSALHAHAGSLWQMGRQRQRLSLPRRGGRLDETSNGQAQGQGEQPDGEM